METKPTTIRPLRTQDIHDVYQLHRTLLPLSYPPAFFRQCVLLPHKQLCLVVESPTSPKIVGFLTASVQQAPQSPIRELHILTLGVASTHRRQGLATELISTAISLLQKNLARLVVASADDSPLRIKLVAHSATSNAQAREFFHKLMGQEMEEETVEGLYRQSGVLAKDAYRFTSYTPLVSVSA